MLRKFFACILVIAMMTVFLMSSAMAIDPGEERVTIGADLTEEQIDQIYEDFDLERGSVIELTVTNNEERYYLEGLVPDKKIGTHAISSIYIMTLEEGSGITVTTNNINWCTVDMYVNALTTVGVEDAMLMVSAPYPVSGTAALTGFYKAYEDISGEELDATAKEVAAEELVITGELAETIGSENATELINELKKILDQTREMTDEELKAEILNIADNIDVVLTDDEVDRIVSLCRTLERIDVSEWADKITQLQATLQKAQETGENVSSFFTSVGDFFTNVFSSVGNFFKNLFS